MRSRRGIGGIASNPVLVGAVTVVIVIVAVFLAYNANNGLPFVPTYRLKAQVPNANALVNGNEVRVGGIRVGVVRNVKPIRMPDGSYAAQLDLSLDENVDPLPVDTTMVIRNKSSIGLKYLEVDPGTSDRGYKEGATIPVSHYKPQTVELDDLFNTFDGETRRDIRGSLTGFGDALAGRGANLNDAFVVLRPLLVKLVPAVRNLVSPQTNFAGFWRALEATAAEVAPVGETQAQLFVALDRTFGAFARVARPYIQETIAKSPPTEDTAIEVLPVLRPFFGHFRQFFAALEPGARALGRTSPVIAAALRAGIPVLNTAPVLNSQLPPTAAALVDFQNAAGVIPGLDLLTETGQTLDPGLRFITPAQSTCNYLSLLFRNAAGIGQRGNDLGTWVGVAPKAPPEGEKADPDGSTVDILGPNNLGMPASAPANGGSGFSEQTNHLHYNPYPYTASPGQPRACMAGNEKYVRGRTLIGNPPQRRTLTTNDQTQAQKSGGGG